ncbi:Ribosomal protein L34e superfamily protein [Zostera marina]|uniref:Ribosomal protein L34e superfamily protein n=1 Tax=Zostera marina TaxID=29655 RepID=A0A0K9PPQ2_ZOSMR|nr:Ribosomal protein L34e superfamily protein [Zostera marina]
MSATIPPVKSRRRSGGNTAGTISSANSTSNILSSRFTMTCNNHTSSSLITLDNLLLLLILFSCSYLVFSSFSHIIQSLLIFLPSPMPLIPLILGVLVCLVSASIFVSLERGRSCGRARCKRLRDAVEFDVKVQTEEKVRRLVIVEEEEEVWREIADLPWKGGGVGDNPDYECVRKELRRMAPSNGRAVLLFRARCGCPLAKLEGWGPRKGRRIKSASFSKSGVIS